MDKNVALTSSVAAALIAVSALTPSAEPQWEDPVADLDTAVCVDSQGYRVADPNCHEGDTNGSGSSAHGGGRWFYLNRGARLPFLLDSVSGAAQDGSGSYERRPGISYYQAPSSVNMTRSRAVSRGGLGSSGRRFGGGWS
ncbi:hypothetical protein [Rhizorhabdus phycosphaerae]|uniref:hypothetical protein n=1 Tax=Rhizorhabdus phycosphaerae TaxID=2711156 RepID=UPI0013EC607D|nr:hypothetical protein [Rhizorhabdus phycosphaerae]